MGGKAHVLRDIGYQPMVDVDAKKTRNWASM
jgi:hypothetical protein